MELDGAEHMSADYRVLFLAYACMEPMNCTMRMDGDSADVWFGNQGLICGVGQPPR